MATPPARTELADTYPNPSNAQFRTGIGKLWDYVTTLLGATGNAAQARAALGIGNVISFRNLLINANGYWNQRAYVSGVATTGANQYTLDRWRVVTSGQNLAFTAAGPDRTMTAPAGGVEQPIHGSNIEGGIYTLSWTGTATATVNGTAITNGGQTAALPANTNAIVRFIGGTVIRPQFELGSVATPYERRNEQFERSLCQPYAELCAPTFRTYSGAAGSTVYDVTYSYKATKMGTPTLIPLGSVTAANVSSEISAAAVNAPTESFRYEVTAAGANQDTFIFGRVFLADAEI